MTDRKTVDVEQLGAYVATGLQLIPLHAYDATDEHKGKTRLRGKSPLHKNWTKRSYTNREVLAYAEEGGNVGVRLTASDLVVDVDPRNFPEGETLETDNPFRRLCADVGLDPSDYPTVVTGSGGLHLYMRKPADVSLMDTHPSYAGVEFKSRGRQVVAAGSVHPETLATYSWDELGAPLEASGAPEAPRLLVDVARRPASAAASGGGEYDQEELADMLDHLDPEEFRDQDRWLQLMMACHHATAGDGRAEFIEWSTRDPLYSGDGTIGLRWDSLHKGGQGGSGPAVTFRTLHKFLRDAGAGDAIPRTPARDDFAGVEDDGLAPPHADEDPLGEEVPEHERKGPLERMNDVYAAVMEGSQFRIYWEEWDPESVPMRKHWVRAKPYDFHQMLANRKVQSGERTVPLSEAWLEWGGRKTYRGVVFDPERDHKGYLNMWTGWAVVPKRKPGGWSLLEELLHDVLCDGNEEVWKYVLDWSANMVQRPGSPAEVAVCFQGGKGVGKGTFFRALCSLAGKHGMQITSSEHLTGRFNDHLRDVLFLFADEAVKAYDKDGESRLKGLITEPVLTFEGKGRDARPGRNRLHIGMASNEDWFVPMGLDGERRFLLQRANLRWKDNTAKFDALNRQLKEGGLEAMLFDLLDRDIVGWSPRDRIPSTGASVDQKIRNMGPIPAWWFNILCEGEWPFEPAQDATDGEDDDRAVTKFFKQDVRNDFDEHCHRSGIRSPGANGRSVDVLFAAELKKMVPGLEDRMKARVPSDRIDVKALGDGRAWCYGLPRVEDCRRSMEALLGGPVDWGNQSQVDLGAF